MIKFKKGSRRIVFVLGEKYVIKIPLLWGGANCLFGMMENLNERTWYCGDGTAEKMNEQYPLASILYADRFGFFQLTRYYKPLNEIKDPITEIGITQDQLDIKIKECIEWSKGFSFSADLENEHGLSNIGWSKLTNRVVAIDYGYFGMRNYYECSPATTRNGRHTLYWYRKQLTWWIEKKVKNLIKKFKK